MARRKAPQLTERELEVMHVFWEAPGPEQTIAEVRETLAARGQDLAHTTVATFITILVRKKFLEQTNDERPLRFRPIRSADDVSQNVLQDVLKRVFRGSRPALLKCLLGQERISPKERAEIDRLLREQKK